MPKQKSFLMSFSWVAVMLMGMGLLFLSLAVVMQLVPISFEDISTTANGVPQPTAANSVSAFRLAFLLAFGIPSLMLLSAGGIVGGCIAARKKRAKWLKTEGRCVSAQITECTPTNIRVNYRYLMRLKCAYTAPGGITYIFKSGTLRMDPMPYLTQGEVKVYYDRDNIKRYFVDVDGSVGVGSRVIEL